MLFTQQHLMSTIDTSRVCCAQPTNLIRIAQDYSYCSHDGACPSEIPSPLGGLRSYLWGNISAAGINVSFVGSRSNGHIVSSSSIIQEKGVTRKGAPRVFVATILNTIDPIHPNCIPAVGAFNAALPAVVAAAAANGLNVTLVDINGETGCAVRTWTTRIAARRTTKATRRTARCIPRAGATVALRRRGGVISSPHWSGWTHCRKGRYNVTGEQVPAHVGSVGG